MKVVFNGNDTSYPVEGDIVTVNLSYGLGDTTLFDSKSLQVPMEFPLLKSAFSGDLYEGLTFMHKGDSAIISVVADSFFIKSAQLKSLPDFVTPGEVLTYHVKLLNFVDRTAYERVKEERKLLKQEEEQSKITHYLDQLETNYYKTSSGLIYFIEKEGWGKRPDTSEMCQVFLEVSILEGDTLFSNFNSDAFDVEFGKVFDNVGFMEGLGLMKEGETARFIVPSKIGVGSDGYDGVPGFTTLDYTVHFVQIRPLEVVQAERVKRKEAKKRLLAQNKQLEKEIIMQYLKKSHWKDDSLASGLYLAYISKGNGNRPEKVGSEVLVHYVQYSLDGKILASSYDTNEPFKFTTGQFEVIEGWEEAVQNMVEGDKVHLLIPSKLGYGSRGRGKQSPPYTPLVFDLELIRVK